MITRISGIVPSRLRRWLTLPAGIAATVAVAVVLAGGVAYAAWTSSGSGTATAKAGTASAPTTTTLGGSAVTSGFLYPGTSGDAVIQVNNPNSYPVNVTAIAPAGAVTASGGSGTCTTTGVSFSTQNPTSGNSIGANSSATLALKNAVAMSANSDSGCQGATFTIPVTVTISS